MRFCRGRIPWLFRLGTLHYWGITPSENLSLIRRILVGWLFWELNPEMLGSLWLKASAIFGGGGDHFGWRLPWLGRWAMPLAEDGRTSSLKERALKGVDFVCPTHLPCPVLMPAWSLLIGPARSLPLSSQLALSFTVPLLLAYIWPLWVPSHHFSPVDGDSMLLQNAGFYQLVHMVSYAKRTSSVLSLPWKR
jgi:hypothetical protein